MSEAASSLAPGAVFGRYVLVEKLGRGAMGEVWVAIDPDLDRKVALKLLRGDRIVRPEDRARLDTEARLMARLTHPNVVTIHDVGKLGERLFIAMEFIDGESLDRWIARGPHPWQEVLAIMRQAGAGLAAAHADGLVHRDFKPANVMLGRDGRVRVLDFGLARPEGSVPTDAESTPRSVTLESDDATSTTDPRSRSKVRGRRRIQGSPAYMSPEQHRAGPVDARSDLFSFCVSLFEALYGVRPFRGTNRLAVALAIVEGRMTEPPSEARARVPEWIHAIVVRGLAGDPGQRFADMDELLAALERSPEERRRRQLGVVAAAVGVAGLVAAVIALRPGPEPSPCEGANAAIVEVWDADTRARLRAQIDGQANARPLSGRRLIEGIDAHVETWAAASEQLCRDRRAKRSTERLQATRAECLAERRAAVEALVRLAAKNQLFVERLAAQPFAAVRALGDPSGCVDRAASSEALVVPSEAQRAARSEIELTLTVLEQVPDSLLAEISGAEADPEFALLLDRVALARGDVDAEARLHASAAAAAGEEPQLAARAWLALVELELARLEAADAPADPRERAAIRDRAGQLIDYADALLPEHDAIARAELGLLAGRLAQHDEPRDPPSLLDAAIERLAKDERAPDLAIALLELRASLDERAGRSAAASEARSRAEQIAIAALGATASPQ